MVQTTKAMRTAGWVLTGLAAAFLLFDGIIHATREQHAVASSEALGLPAAVLPVIGIIELASLGAYLVPRTAVLGAVLLTGYLGGAIATNLRAGQAPFNDVFPLLVGALVWGGLWLRDLGVRALLPVRERPGRSP